MNIDQSPFESKVLSKYRIKIGKDQNLELGNTLIEDLGNGITIVHVKINEIQPINEQIYTIRNAMPRINDKQIQVISWIEINEPIKLVENTHQLFI